MLLKKYIKIVKLKILFKVLVVQIRHCVERSLCRKIVKGKSAKSYCPLYYHDIILYNIIQVECPYRTMISLIDVAEIEKPKCPRVVFSMGIHNSNVITNV